MIYRTKAYDSTMQIADNNKTSLRISLTHHGVPLYFTVPSITKLIVAVQYTVKTGLHSQ